MRKRSLFPTHSTLLASNSNCGTQYVCPSAYKHLSPWSLPCRDGTPHPTHWEKTGSRDLTILWKAEFCGAEQGRSGGSHHPSLCSLLGGGGGGTREPLAQPQGTWPTVQQARAQEHTVFFTLSCMNNLWSRILSGIQVTNREENRVGGE